MLLATISLGVLRVLTAIVLPVLRMAPSPRTLGAPLVVSIVGIAAALFLLPAPSLLLAPLGLAKTLPRSLGLRHKHSSARSTAPLLHRLSLPNLD
jgi:hypothetical protein